MASPAITVFLVFSLSALPYSYQLPIIYGGRYCRVGNTSTGPEAPVSPSENVMIFCEVDNRDDAPHNILKWMIASHKVFLVNLNGGDGVDPDQPEFVSKVISFNNSEKTTNASLSFPLTPDLEGAIVRCFDNVGTEANCTLRFSLPGNSLCGMILY